MEIFFVFKRLISDIICFCSFTGVEKMHDYSYKTYRYYELNCELILHLDNACCISLVVDEPKISDINNQTDCLPILSAKRFFM